MSKLEDVRTAMNVLQIVANRRLKVVDEMDRITDEIRRESEDGCRKRTFETLSRSDKIQINMYCADSDLPVYRFGISVEEARQVINDFHARRGARLQELTSSASNLYDDVLDKARALVRTVDQPNNS